jgi:hypothetical protein
VGEAAVRGFTRRLLIQFLLSNSQLDANIDISAGFLSLYGIFKSFFFQLYWINYCHTAKGIVLGNCLLTSTVL